MTAAFLCFKTSMRLVISPVYLVDVRGTVVA